MTARRKTLDTVLRYRGYHGCPSFCRVRVYEGKDGEGIAPVLVATELESNPGTSVTNRIEVIATEIYRWLERPEAGLKVIEHYGASRIAPERFGLVTLRWDRNQGLVSPKMEPYLPPGDLRKDGLYYVTQEGEAKARRVLSQARRILRRAFRCRYGQQICPEPLTFFLKMAIVRPAGKGHPCRRIEE